MKLKKDAIRNMVQEVLTERSEDSMLLSEATFGSVQGRINPEERPERTAQEFIVMSSDRGERSPIIKAFDSAGAAQEWGGPWSSIEAVKADENLWSRLRGGGTPFKFKEDLAEAEEVVEIEAPNSVIEAMRRVSENPGKKVKFVRRRNE